MKTFYDFLSESERIDEMATVIKDRRNNVLIQVNPSETRIGDEYFKFYNSNSYKASNKLCRICFREPRYIIHSGDGKETWVLNSSEKKLLITILNSNSDKISETGKILSNWEKCITCHNEERDLEEGDEGYIPIDLEMPDYMKLSD